MKTKITPMVCGTIPDGERRCTDGVTGYTQDK